jgi:hypothetical protein
MPFSWPQSRVKLAGERLVIADPVYERASELPEVPGGWMRLAAREPSARVARSLAATYGFLRAPGESVGDWQAMMALLYAIAQPWIYPGDLYDRKLQELPAPRGVAAAAALIVARRVALDLQRRAIERGDVALAAGEAGFEIQPQTLAGFLVITASAALNERPGFRRCLWCADWYAAGRRDQVYCIPRHRWQASNEKRERP